MRFLDVAGPDPEITEPMNMGLLIGLIVFVAVIIVITVIVIKKNNDSNEKRSKK